MPTRATTPTPKHPRKNPTPMTNKQPPGSIYVVVNEDGDIRTGGGSSSRPAVHAYPSEKEARTYVKRAMNSYRPPRYRIVEYHLAPSK